MSSRVLTFLAIPQWKLPNIVPRNQVLFGQSRGVIRAVLAAATLAYEQVTSSHFYLWGGQKLSKRDSPTIKPERQDLMHGACGLACVSQWSGVFPIVEDLAQFPRFQPKNAIRKILDSSFDSEMGFPSR